ncbi:MAG: GNAT family N-acetyltransferase [Verrucomicrobia bacterium]|nr:GNAT family N-acetyltransferase [Verrucomicrobiota bacterium]
MSDLQIRFAQPEDAETVHRLVVDLAVYEKLSHEVVSTPEDLRRALVRPQPMVEVLLAEISRKPVGFALFFQTFSTFVGRAGIYLEDLFVLPEFRRGGIATALFQELFRIARERDCVRVEWTVLDWNEPAIKFYSEKLGARILKEWWRCRVEVRPGTPAAPGTP